MHKREYKIDRNKYLMYKKSAGGNNFNVNIIKRVC